MAEVAQQLRQLNRGMAARSGIVSSVKSTDAASVPIDDATTLVINRSAQQPARPGADGKPRS